METERKKEFPRKADTPKVLIVDDISMNVEIMENIITEQGYEVLSALNVRDAIDLMKETMPSLILSDLSMPEIDGLEFCRIVKSNPITRDIPFIFISVLDTREEKEQAFLAGAVDFIPKPFERVEVIMRVNNHLNSYRIKREMADYNRMMHRMVDEQKKQIEQERANMLLALAKVIRKRYNNRGRYLEHLGYNCGLLAQSLQLLPEYENEISDEFLETIEAVAELHDIGDVVIPDAYSLKNRNTEEWIRRHTEEGAGILEEILADQKESHFLTMAVQIARCHHTKWDGTGYPALSGKEIPLEARIVALVNGFDHLVHSDGVEETAPEAVEKAVEIIKERSGTFYEPTMVRVFDKIWRQMRMN